MTLGMEYGGKSELLTHWVDDLIQREPAPSFIVGLVRADHHQPPVTESGRGRGIRGAGTERDLRERRRQRRSPMIRPRDRPMDVLANSKEIKKWSGVMALRILR